LTTVTVPGASATTREETMPKQRRKLELARADDMADLIANGIFEDRPGLR
jgi:hypothetical protein